MKSAIAAKPDKAPAYYNLAEAYAASGDGPNAIKTYQQIMQMEPNNALPVYKIGTTYGKVMNDLDNATAWLTKAIEKAPTEPLYYEDLGVAYGMKGDISKAIATFKKGIEINPTYAAFYRNLAASYYQLGETEEAQKYQAQFEQMNK